MKRTLILISNDGGRSNFLPGVAHDVANYYNFFHSDNGGAWENEEIVRFDSNLTKAHLRSTLLSMICDFDYFLIVFVGHGYADEYGHTVLELSPGNDSPLYEIETLLSSKKYLIIVDSCRKILNYRDGGQLMEQRDFSTLSQSSLHREACRKYYNNMIANANDSSHVVSYATSLDQCANDTQRGGLYSYTLVTYAKNWIQQVEDSIYFSNDSFKILGIIEAHQSVKNKVYQKTLGQQVPTIKGYADFPLAVVVNPQILMPDY